MLLFLLLSFIFIGLVSGQCSFTNCASCKASTGCGWCASDGTTGTCRVVSGSCSGGALSFLSSCFSGGSNWICSASTQCPATNPCAGITCSGRGTCSNGVCSCSSGFSGSNCETTSSTFSACSGTYCASRSSNSMINGVYYCCLSGTISSSSVVNGVASVQCSQSQTCPASDCNTISQCSTCRSTNGCGWCSSSSACMVTSLSSCSNSLIGSSGTCPVANPCAGVTCQSGGTCTNGQCYYAACTQCRTGSVCCPSGGTLSGSTCTAPQICTDQCNSLNSCSACTSSSNCGWCGSTGQCQHCSGSGCGTSNGVRCTTGNNWSFSSCPTCSSYSSCANCKSASGCSWCSTSSSCLSSTSTSCSSALVSSSSTCPSASNCETCDVSSSCGSFGVFSIDVQPGQCPYAQANIRLISSSIAGSDTIFAKCPTSTLSLLCNLMSVAIRDPTYAPGCNFYSITASSIYRVCQSSAVQFGYNCGYSDQEVISYTSSFPTSNCFAAASVKESSSSDSTQMIVIAGAAGGGSVALIGLVALLWFCKFRKSKTAKIAPNAPSQDRKIELEGYPITR